MSSLLDNILLHKCPICYFDETSNSEIVIRNCRRGIPNYASTKFSEKMKINPIFQRPLSQHHHHLPTASVWIKSGTATLISAKYPTFISLGITTETKYHEKAHCTMQGRLQTLEPYEMAGTAKDILLHTCLLQQREELLYFCYFSIYVKALASQLIVTSKHLVNHLHRNHQTKLGITGTPLSPCSSNFQGISAKCLSITYLDTSTPLQHIQKASKLPVCLWRQNVSLVTHFLLSRG